MGSLIWHCQTFELLFLSLYFQLLCSLSFSSPHSAHLYHQDQCTALLQFKNAFSTSESASDSCEVSYHRTKSWKKSTDCCKWDAVSCDSSTGHVVGLDLSCSRLYGRIHSNNTLFLLQHLKTLNLANNDFRDSSISFRFGQFPSLTHLNLSCSVFSGQVSSEISYLSKLASLDLSYNFLIFGRYDFERVFQNLTALSDLILDSGNMALITPSHLLNLSSSLKSLSLVDCGLQGKLPDNIFSLPNLQILNIPNNDLTGNLPEFNESNRLRFLDLSRTLISGKLPSSIGKLRFLNTLNLEGSHFAGSIPNSLGNLTELTSLLLSLNNFSGTIPNVFHNLHNITELCLCANRFSGQIPSSIFNMTQLSLLFLSSNQLVGPLPPQTDGLSILRFMDLSENLLNGPIPSWLFILPTLENLHLQNNQLTGQIHEFKCKTLISMDISNNVINGPIRRSFFELENLVYACLSSNNFSGILDLNMLSKLQHLVSLDLSYNNHLTLISGNYTKSNSIWPKLDSLFLSSCNMKEFPLFLRTQDKLLDLDLSDNKIHGRIPERQWNLSSLQKLNLSFNFLTEFPNFLRTLDGLQCLDISHNQIHDKIPENLSDGLQTLSLSHNQIHGKIPENLLLVNAIQILISGNKLTGEIPSFICDATSLVMLDLSDNHFTGRIPECLGNLNLLQVLDVKMNSLHGSIRLQFAKGNELRNLNFNSNQLEGLLPRSLVNCTSLEILDVGNNKLSGSFPHWLGSLQELQVLVLRSNRFHGPMQNPKSNFSFPMLRIVDLSCNAFSGFLPTRFFKNLESTMHVDEAEGGIRYMGYYDASYHASVILTMKGRTFTLVRILTILDAIDLSNNRFEGQIPSELGNLKSLEALNFSHNCLSGRIPMSLENMTALESLDLSYNKLVGEIPQQLKSLTFLEVLNLSYNLLGGPIPRGNQFDTFNNDSYLGNPRLCGFPLLKKCVHDEAPEPQATMNHGEDDSASLFDWKMAKIGYGSGLVIGVSLASIAFTIRRPRWLIKMVERKRRRRLTKQNRRRRQKRH